MILDFSTRVTGATPQAITATVVSVDSYNIGHANRDIGPGEDVKFEVRTSQAFNNLTSLTIDLVSSAVTALTTPTVHVSSGAIPLASLAANRVVFSGVVPRGVALQHLGYRFTVAGTAPTTGSVVGDIGTGEFQSSFTGGL
jgi:hypothetical protein